MLRSKSLKVALSSLLAVILLASPLMLGATAAAADAGITVTGSGSVTVTPDIAVLYIGVETTAKAALDAQAENAERSAQLIAALKAAGIADADIGTSHYSLWEDYTYTNEGNRQHSGYIVSNSLRVTVRDVKAAGTIIDLATANGANRMTGLDFSIGDQSAAYGEALKLAVRSAGAKAGIIAEAAGVRLGGVSAIVESSYGGYYAEAAADSVRAAGGATSVEVGTLTVTANVTVTYGIK